MLFSVPHLILKDIAVFKYSNLVKVLARNMEPELIAGLCDSYRPAVVICCGDMWRVSEESCVSVVDDHGRP